jgi:microcystin-dependent protein
MASHTHVVNSSDLRVSGPACHHGPAHQRGPGADAFAEEAAAVTATYSSNAPNASMNASAITTGGAVAGNAGGGQPHTNLQPSMAIGFCICVQGTFPSQV